MDIASRLERVEQEIVQVENEKLQREQMLAAFWEHMPVIDPAILLHRMSLLRNQIDFLEDRKRALLEERKELIVQAVLLGDRRD